ncbi:MAG: IS607 family transposase [Ignisphaera sp.]
MRRGWIKPVVLESSRWRVREEDVEKLMGIVKMKAVILYARVFSHTQKDDLERQIKVLEEWIKQNNVEKYEVIMDIGSGLIEDRKGFKKILRLAVEKKISKVVVAYSDRFIRFRFKTLVELLKAFGVEVVVLDYEDKDPEEELVEDLITIISHFAGKLYGMRSRKYRKVIEDARKLIEDP